MSLKEFSTIEITDGSEFLAVQSRFPTMRKKYLCECSNKLKVRNHLVNPFAFGIIHLRRLHFLRGRGLKFEKFADG